MMSNRHYRQLTRQLWGSHHVLSSSNVARRPSPSLPQRAFLSHRPSLGKVPSTDLSCNKCGDRLVLCAPAPPAALPYDYDEGTGTGLSPVSPRAHSWAWATCNGCRLAYRLPVIQYPSHSGETTLERRGNQGSSEKYMKGAGNRLYTNDGAVSSLKDHTLLYSQLSKIRAANERTFNHTNASDSRKSLPTIPPPTGRPLYITSPGGSHYGSMGKGNGEDEGGYGDDRDSPSFFTMRGGRRETTNNNAASPPLIDTSSSNLFTPLTPREMYNMLNDHVVGQEGMKRVLCVAMQNHYKRIEMKMERDNREVKAAEVKRDEDVVRRNFEMERHRLHYHLPHSTQYPAYGVFDPYLQYHDEDSLDHMDSRNESLHADNIPLPVSEVQVDEDVTVEKSNILIIGPTGSGKTLVIKTLAKMLNVPLHIGDATTLTQAGYVGQDVDSLVAGLYQKSGFDVERTQRGIVYIDEVDKLAKKRDSGTTGRDVSGEGVQQSLLAMLEGTSVNVTKEPGNRNKGTVQIDTTDILFILGGSFPGLEKLIKRRKTPTKVGFGGVVNDPNDKNMEALLSEVQAEDLQAFGFIPEFIGRLPMVVTTSKLTEDQLVKIMTEPKNSIVKQFKALFKKINSRAELHITNKAIREVAKQALARKTGARGLRAMIENVLIDAQFVAPERTELNAVYVDASTIRGERSPLLLEKHVTLDKYLEQYGEDNVEVEDGGSASSGLEEEGVEEAKMSL